MAENESSNEIDSQWNYISDKVNALGKGIDANIARAEQLLVDIEFLRLMAAEDLI